MRIKGRNESRNFDFDFSGLKFCRKYMEVCWWGKANLYKRSELNSRPQAGHAPLVRLCLPSDVVKVAHCFLIISMAQPDRMIQLLVLQLTFDNVRVVHRRNPIIDLCQAQVKAFVAAVNSI